MSYIRFQEMREKTNILRVQTDPVTGKLSRLVIGSIRKYPQPARVVLTATVASEEQKIIDQRLGMLNEQAMQVKILEAAELPAMIRDAVGLVGSGVVSDLSLLDDLEHAARQLLRAIKEYNSPS
ncbi:hypothetical protein SLH49_14985 [Cognatiyoonia sp. IB215446]|uniref:hypothetical protein n=1 Tax=Cognatiyoonia sp. IB215446 TaxID=3097355 RepID=UPI002A0DC46E|nr:hypothetical protein [Cognatiyoonia sp. IB215446]MDX8349290.1 hypothetical protein [Cognatiyoonia sp. IB215446]